MILPGNLKHRQKKDVVNYTNIVKTKKYKN